MEITFTRSDKTRKSTMAVYVAEGRSGSLRFAKSLFVGKQAPATLTLANDAFAGPRVKETPEERKARMALLPKLTLAEKIAKREKELMAMRSKLASQPTVTPAPAPTPVVRQAAPAASKAKKTNKR